MESKSIMEKLLAIQTELHVPKNQKNKFGNYNYRSSEDILEAIKPLSKKYNVLFKINEKVVEIKDEVALISTVKVFDIDNPTHSIETDAIAFVDFFAKGMQRPQQSGSASSYGKKYALGNLLLIDDTPDSDATNDHKTEALNNSHPNWAKVSTYVKKNGAASINKLKAKYTFTKEVEAELTKIANS
jgi:hypothetical protein